MSYRFWSHFRICVFGLTMVAGLVLFIHGLLQLLGWQGLWESRDRYSSRALIFFDGSEIRVLKRLAFVAIGAALIWFPMGAIRDELSDE